MADNTQIEWTDATWNPITGCSVHSAGCTNCYAMKLAGTRLKHVASRKGLTTMTKAGPVWTGEVRFNEAELLKPLSWKKPRMIFVCAHGDLFHENVPDGWIDRVFAVMALCPQHTFQVLTKRSDRMREYFARLNPNNHHPAMDVAAVMACTGRWNTPALHLIEGWPLANVWLGVSVEHQTAADTRIPDLLATPAAIRWISAEPLLGPVNIAPWLNPDAFCMICDCRYGYGNRCASKDIPRNEQCPWKRAVQIYTEHGPFKDDGEPAYVSADVITLDWIVVGGESGPGARPMHPDWARSLRDQCATAGVPFFFKQWGEWVPVCGAVDAWDISDHPEQSRFDHRDWDDGKWGEPYRPCWMDETEDDTVFRVGKKAAGRLLDGIEHNAVPQVQP